MAGSSRAAGAVAGGSGAGEAVDAEETPFVVVGVVGDEVPDRVGGDQGVRLHPAWTGLTATGAVGEGGDLVVAAGRRQGGQDGGIGLGPGAPGQRERSGRRLDRGDLVAQPDRQHLLQLGQSAHRGLLDPGDTSGGGAQGDRDGHGLVVIEEQGWHISAGGQAVAARGPGSALDRVAEIAQPVDVTADGAQGDAEPFGEFGAGPGAARLEQGEHAQHAGGQVLGHVFQAASH